MAPREDNHSCRLRESMQRQKNAPRVLRSVQPTQVQNIQSATHQSCSQRHAQSQRSCSCKRVKLLRIRPIAPHTRFKLSIVRQAQPNTSLRVRLPQTTYRSLQQESKVEILAPDLRMCRGQESTICWRTTASYLTVNRSKDFKLRLTLATLKLVGRRQS